MCFDLGFDLGVGLGLWLGSESDGADMETHGSEGHAADAVGQENSEGQRCEAGTS
ncbi:MAG: hypothetical protein WAK33_07115 [Silvibacterium sp.]